jgi:hypothetical protein
LVSFFAIDKNESISPSTFYATAGSLIHAAKNRLGKKSENGLFLFISKRTVAGSQVRRALFFGHYKSSDF